MLVLPPLSLYIHIPWCVQKCPYCDFNSHAQKGNIPEQDYVQHLLADLRQDLERYQESIAHRSLHSIFIGGGTPSLFSATAISQLLQGIEQQIPFEPEIEITLEANPGTAEASRFSGYVEAGVNRLSLGIQSFDDEKLQRLGRIHNSREAQSAVQMAKDSGFHRINLDLMHGLPEQTLPQALEDLRQAIALEPSHLSWYQLTIEPNTMFAYRPPTLPDDDALWDIFEQGHQLLTTAGYQQYETSAYAKAGDQCQHNLNYWRFGDYLAIGCGAHGKLSFTNSDIIRFSKTKHPKGYMRGEYLYEEKPITLTDRPFEFFMNRFRLLEAFPKTEFQQLTGLSSDVIREPMNWAKRKKYVQETDRTWQITQQGKLFLNELLTEFLSEDH
ncbi:radical SAM family heme chaperone HemW [Avibacterium paragallinarum]|uniref:radical SAM family heme chaperone HemW n=1 Tax=Avibacterium paragallinarum TaxID=728 RepID=UPI00021ACDC7|nr:radical SAM family heme chaperone HemW [Avibacterium paragallinarum]AZI14753.1 radical SAM family heme chaperone HemW [Avibacterium paragallinarum]QIR12190.1 radical SAM family heme chaperone HemW [Avibacterium paragallinarum]QJE08988.1 radical SAM family heme chaperone HemW [Avibacterium paragallinarum]QJE11185.1 radical SAM family heme chaperone HemW [Avibacterium paragallinarum]QJE13382.1 radical SAM family heme chaperone HemW [Avibacterium paragallinarum]